MGECVAGLHPQLIPTIMGECEAGTWVNVWPDHG